MAENSPGFTGLSLDDWRRHAARLFSESESGLSLRYDARLRESFLAGFDPDKPLPDLWPFWQATAGLPVALIRGANSDLLTRSDTAEMRRRRPDMIFAEVPDRAHIPFLDEAESLAAIDAFLAAVQKAAA